MEKHNIEAEEEMMDMEQVDNYELWIYAWMEHTHGPMARAVDHVMDDARSSVSKLNKEEWNKWVEENKGRFPTLGQTVELEGFTRHPPTE